MAKFQIENVTVYIAMVKNRDKSMASEVSYSATDSDS